MTEGNHGDIWLARGEELIKLEGLMLFSEMSEIMACEQLDEPLENNQPLSVVVDESGFGVTITPELAAQIWELAMNYDMKGK
jgi:hypothetical protein